MLPKQLKSSSDLLGRRTCPPSTTLPLHFHSRAPSYCPCGAKYCFSGCLLGNHCSLGKGSCFCTCFPAVSWAEGRYKSALPSSEKALMKGTQSMTLSECTGFCQDVRCDTLCPHSVLSHFLPSFWLRYIIFPEQTMIKEQRLQSKAGPLGESGSATAILRVNGKYQVLGLSVSCLLLAGYPPKK